MAKKTDRAWQARTEDCWYLWGVSIPVTSTSSTQNVEGLVFASSADQAKFLAYNNWWNDPYHPHIRWGRHFKHFDEFRQEALVVPVKGPFPAHQAVRGKKFQLVECSWCPICETTRTGKKQACPNCGNAMKFTTVITAKQGLDNDPEQRVLPIVVPTKTFYDEGV